MITQSAYPPFGDSRDGIQRPSVFGAGRLLSGAQAKKESSRLIAILEAALSPGDDKTVKKISKL